MQKRRFIMLLALALALVLVTACTGQESGEAPADDTGDTTAEEEPAEPTATEAEEETAEPTATEGEAGGGEAEPTATEEGETDSATAPDVQVERVCLVTDIGTINDGTFNEYAYNGMLQAAEDFGLEESFIETQSEVDYERNIRTCVSEEFDVIVTVGFLIGDATLAAAEANSEIMFIGVDQFYEEPPSNLVGIQYREDQGGFLVGALGCMMTESNVVGGVYGIDVPAVKKFRHGFEHGCQYVNPDAQPLGAYIQSFTDSAQGASLAEQYLGEGADVVFGAGGQTGSGGIRRAAEQGAWVIGVDQDEWFTTFGEGSSPGADRLLTSAVKRVDRGVYDQIQGLVEPESGLWSGGGHYILEIANDGIDYAPFHEAEDDVPAAAKERLDEIKANLGDGTLTTGVDPVTGDVVEEEIPEPAPYEGS